MAEFSSQKAEVNAPRDISPNLYIASCFVEDSKKQEKASNILFDTQFRGKAQRLAYFGSYRCKVCRKCVFMCCAHYTIDTRVRWKVS